MQSWSATTAILLLFVPRRLLRHRHWCVWEATKLCLKKLLVKIGLSGPKTVHTRMRGINIEQAVTVIPAAAAPRATTTTTLVATTSGSIYMARLAGECYHMRRNCGHLANRERKVIEKCLDCARFDGKKTDVRGPRYAWIVACDAIEGRAEPS